MRETQEDGEKYDEFHGDLNLKFTKMPLIQAAGFCFSPTEDGEEWDCLNAVASISYNKDAAEGEKWTAKYTIKD